MTKVVNNPDGTKTVVELFGWTPEEMAAYWESDLVDLELLDQEEQKEPDWDDYFDFQREADEAWRQSRGC